MRQAQPISYRRADLNSLEWHYVGSFTSIAAWHRASAVLQRHGIPTRMAENPYDLDATSLLVPAQAVHLAGELIRQMHDPNVETALRNPIHSP